MPAQIESTTVRFLSEAREFQCALPVDVDLTKPVLGSVVTFGGRARDVVFRHGEDPSNDSDLAFIEDVRHGGITISIFEFSEPPSLLLAFWRLGGDRYLTTSMAGRDPEDPDSFDGPGRPGLQAVIENLTVGWASGLPLVAISGPLQPGDIRSQIERDTVSYYADRSDAAIRMVELKREPSWTREMPATSIGQGVETVGDGHWHEASAVSGTQVRVTCSGPGGSAEMEEAARQVAASLPA